MTNAIRILHVEDSEMDVQLLALAFSHIVPETKIIITVAGMVAEAMKAFESEKFDIALIDWNLPDGEGMEVAQHMRAKGSQLPIIFLTGTLTDQHVQEASCYAPKACFTKEYHQEQITKILSAVNE